MQFTVSQRYPQERRGVANRDIYVRDSLLLCSELNISDQAVGLYTQQLVNEGRDFNRLRSYDKLLIALLNVALHEKIGSQWKGVSIYVGSRIGRRWLVGVLYIIQHGLVY